MYVCACIWRIQYIRITHWSKTDHNVSIALAQLLKDQWGDIRPNVQCLADGSVYISLLQIWCIIHYPATSGDRRQGKWVNKWCWWSCSKLLGKIFQCVPECHFVILPFEVSREVVVLPDVRDAASGLLHQLQSVVVQISRHLQKRWKQNMLDGYMVKCCPVCSAPWTQQFKSLTKAVVMAIKVTQLKSIQLSHKNAFPKF